MILQLDNRDLPEIFKEVTNVERVSSMRYGTAIGDTTASVYEVEVDAVQPFPYLCAFRSGTSEVRETEIYTIGERFFIKNGQELSVEDMTDLLSGEAHLRNDFVTWEATPVVVIHEPLPA